MAINKKSLTSDSPAVKLTGKKTSKSNPPVKAARMATATAMKTTMQTTMRPV